MSYFHCGNGYPDRCNGYRGPLDTYVCTSGRHDRRQPAPEPSPEEQAEIDRFGIFDSEDAIRQERRRWVEWLAEVGYGIDFTHHPHPPCTPREVAEVYAEREPIAACDLDADAGETSTEVHEWVIAQNTGWEA